MQQFSSAAEVKPNTKTTGKKGLQLGKKVKAPENLFDQE
jgi:hypothetical protein